MVLNTFTVSAAVTPTVVETYLSHYLNRKPLRKKPTAHITYHEGLRLIRQFLHHASLHTVDELQAFTSQWVPAPTWVKVEEVNIESDQLRRAAELIQVQLGPRGVDLVGGNNWWQWRKGKKTAAGKNGPDTTGDGKELNQPPLEAEWIEMRHDHAVRQKSIQPMGCRIMLYIHGGGYYFGSVGEHRYQLQRHARKLKARVFAPKYRLAPQFPFPCGLQDCLAAYLYLLDQGHDPSTILVAGDSAGGGMALSLLVILRDRGIPAPAGGILISPWCDLTHSFPSLVEDGSFDYIPAHGFQHKPSTSWPPPNADDLAALGLGVVSPESVDNNPRRPSTEFKKQASADRKLGFSVSPAKDDSKSLSSGEKTEEKTEDLKNPPSAPTHHTIPTRYNNLSIDLDGKHVEIKDQIQLYAPNTLLSHPLVSAVLQPSLGGLPPLHVQVGGGELLRDEQIYMAHKAAAPMMYPPSDTVLDEHDKDRMMLRRYQGTYVQLQVWDDMCHVGPTLSFTRPAKYMYRSIAQFGAWALAHAQRTTVDILDDDDISVISVSSKSSDDSEKRGRRGSKEEDEKAKGAPKEQENIGRAGDPLPSFSSRMIRQRVDRHGMIYPFPPASELAACKMEPKDIGTLKPGPVRKWMAAQEKWSAKFSSEKRRVQRKRIKQMKEGYMKWEEDRPPPTALAGRRLERKEAAVEETAGKKSWGMAMWSLWGSKHDEDALQREQSAEIGPQNNGPKSNTIDGNTAAAAAAANLPGDRIPATTSGTTSRHHSLRASISRSRSHSRTGRGPRPSSLDFSPLSSLPTPNNNANRRSHHRTVTDEGQAGPHLLLPTPSPSSPGSPISPSIYISPPGAPRASQPKMIVPTSLSSQAGNGSGAANVVVVPKTTTGSTRPVSVSVTPASSSAKGKGDAESDDGAGEQRIQSVAFPFKLAVGPPSGGRADNASMVTLKSVEGVVEEEEPAGDEVAVEKKAAEEIEKVGPNGEVASPKASDAPDVGRPKPERFITAREGAD